MGKAPLWAAIDLTGVTTTGTVTEGGAADVDYTSDYASLAMQMAESSTIILSGWAADDEYFSASFGLRLPSTPVADTPFLSVYDQSNTLLCEFILTNDGQAELWFDSTMQQTDVINTDLHRYCLRINTIDGRIQLIKDKNTWLDVDALDFTGITGVLRLVFNGAVADASLSSIICDNEDTITRYTVPLDFLAEDTTYNDLTGVVGDLTDRDVETGYAATAADDITLFTHTPLSDIGGAAVSCLCLSAQVSSLVSVSGFKYSVELDSVVYDSAVTLVDSGFVTFANNPTDATDWTLASINAAKVGFKAV